MPSEVSSASVLQILKKQRIADLGRELGVVMGAERPKEDQIRALLSTNLVRFGDLMQQLGRDELKAACRAHGLDDSGRARTLLAGRLLEAHGAVDSAVPAPLFRPKEIPRYAPRPGDIVLCRHRQWLVEEVTAPPAENHQTLVSLVCLDDDNPGRGLQVLWERELGARVLHHEAQPLTEARSIDPPRHFAAYLHALKWNSVTATRADLFQAPFRAGIALHDYQLTPLRKALSLPRANLFIADDVGLGKTIEAGLVLQELLLRQRVDFAVIVCPAGVALQWRDEMTKRFGLRFEVMNRHFIARRRQERGFGVNPWGTHHRFIISHQLLRRPEYRDPLLQYIGERAKKSLLILDEAHVAAPASQSKYAVDSRVTKVIRDVAPRFENRLFLSATPHNGHSNSFSALLEILDPQRFTRGVPITNVAQLGPVMVRRLKADLRELGVRFPRRRVIQLEVGSAASVEVKLSQLLSEYTLLMKPAKGKGKLVFVNLQKRLLSSVRAFARTLRKHQEGIQSGRARDPASRTLARLSTDEAETEYGIDEETLEFARDLEMATRSAKLPAPAARAAQLLSEMLSLTEAHHSVADAKVAGLVDWIREHQCAGAMLGGARPAKHGATWNSRRLIIFTEYADTKKYLVDSLSAAISFTDRAGERILQIHGGMSDEQREEVQAAFNDPAHPVRILIATDAAREGVNLQGQCADLFHFDIPWNPARLEQRNGRIDRTLQPSDEVRCHYFVYPDRAEDIVLKRLIDKVDTIQRELGSLGSVLMDRYERVLDDGIDPSTADRLATVEALREQVATTQRELEQQRALDKLRAEVEDAGKVLNDSRQVMDFDTKQLLDALNVGLELAGASPLKAGSESGVYALPDLPPTWDATVDSLRPTRQRDEPFWEWRKRAALPVVFEAPEELSPGVVHLHLQHPFVQRVLQRFLAQGFSAHDLSRVTIVKSRTDHLVRVIAFGRLSLFGRGAARLHDQLVSVAARWSEGSDEPLKPFADAADRRAIERLEQSLAEAVHAKPTSAAVRKRVLAAAPALFAQLWPAIREEADARASDAINRLKSRANQEAADLIKILEGQRSAIEKALPSRKQLAFDFADTKDEQAQREQLEADITHLEQRLATLDRERATEPEQIQNLYEVRLPRLEPVGLVILWPETRS